MSQFLHFSSSSLPVAWESSGGRPKALGPCTRVGDLDKASGSWLQISSALAFAATWGVNQGTKDLSLRLSFSLYICFSNKNEQIKNKKEIRPSGTA